MEDALNILLYGRGSNILLIKEDIIFFLFLFFFLPRPFPLGKDVVNMQQLS
jgi:hypothetical protein